MKSLQQLLFSGIKFFALSIFIYVFILLVLCNINLGGKPLVYRACQGLVWKGGFTYDRFRDYDAAQQYDVLIFGSSRANRGITPRVLEEYGYTAYNLGTDDQTAINTEVLVKQYVKPGHCKLVILDIYDRVFSASSLESTSDIIQNVDKDAAAFQMAWEAKDMRAINFFTARMLLKNKPRVYSAETKLYKGFRSLEFESEGFAATKSQYKTVKQYLDGLSETLEYLKSINVKVALVSQPMHEYKNIKNHQLLLKDLQPILLNYNTQLYDYTDVDSILTAKDFADVSHLNQTGATKYSHFLVKNLIDRLLNSPAKK